MGLSPGRSHSSGEGEEPLASSRAAGDQSGTAVLSMRGLDGTFAIPVAYPFPEANMFCTQCGVELGETARFCSQCGHSTPLGRPARAPASQLARDVQNKKIAGVCAGFARYMDVDVVLVRVLWLAL